VPEVIGGLMEIHPNLYASIKLRRPSSPEMEVASVLDGDGNIRDEWLNAFKAYPGRFMIGTDLKLGFGPSENPRQITEMYQDLLAWLPEGLDEKIAFENAERLYG